MKPPSHPRPNLAQQDSASGEMTRDESFDIAKEVRQSFAVEERLFSLCHAEGKSLYQQQRYTQKKSEDCVSPTGNFNHVLLTNFRSRKSKFGEIYAKKGSLYID